jgi:hypothetical protein
MTSRKILILAVICFLVIDSFSQGTAKNFSKISELSISIEELEKKFQPALSEDSTKAIFFDRQTVFINAYQTLLKDLNAFLNENDFTWSKPTRCFNRIYFSPDGSIEYFLFHFKPDEISVEQEQAFERLVNQFIQEYKFPLQAKSRFAQCSPVTYKP